MSKQNVKITAVITTGTQCQSKSLRNQNVPIIFFLNSGLQFLDKTWRFRTVYNNNFILTECRSLKDGDLITIDKTSLQHLVGLKFICLNHFNGWTKS